MSLKSIKHFLYFNKQSFHCPRCTSFAHQKWFSFKHDFGFSHFDNDFDVSCCECCQKASIWKSGKLIYPEASLIQPNPDLPEDIQFDFIEASSVLQKSPRSACGLLRLCIQKLLIHLEIRGSTIDEQIGQLVKDKAIPELLQKALDSVRVIGNEAVHPGTIDLRDDVDTARSLFEIVNIIAEKLLTDPQKINSLYDRLPQAKINAIETRNAKS